MSNFDDTTETAAVEARLRRLGGQPVDPAVQSAHLTAMASGRMPNRGLREKIKVAAALAGGFLLGSTGLAFAGALPAPAQDAANEALARVGVSVPVGTARYFGEECVAGVDGEHARNRGQYIKQERAKGADALATAKASDCGMPLSSIAGDDADTDTDAGIDEAGEVEVEATKPEKCIDGAKVTGSSTDRGRSDEAPKATAPCETPRPSSAPGLADDEGVDDDATADADDAAGSSRGQPEDPGRSGEAPGRPAGDDAPGAHDGDGDGDDGDADD